MTVETVNCGCPFSVNHVNIANISESHGAVMSEQKSGEMLLFFSIDGRHLVTDSPSELPGQHPT